jgi:diphosphomevalonate decarboxylase
MKKIDVVRKILAGKTSVARQASARAFAPTNIALCKYWGKRNGEINLPVTDSLSISLGDKGATTSIEEISENADKIILNDQVISADSAFGKRLSVFLDLFRPAPSQYYRVETQMNIPVAAGLASSACGFAALILALDQLYGWQLDMPSLSILARLGSGSAARSLWQGFVEWQAGQREDGMDSHGVTLPLAWPELRIGLHLLSTAQKPLSSREAMQRTVQTSQLYTAWPAQVQKDMRLLKAALAAKDFQKMGETAEANALAMHATMLSAWPPVLYSQPETISAMQKIWQLRAKGAPIYFTQDAGPNLKILFLVDAQAELLAAFPNLQICLE